jgi:SH3-like domain-containing protein
MTPNDYRKRNPRCRTCQHAKAGCYEWFCKAKAQRHEGWLNKTRLRGMLCPLYIPKEYEE